MLGNFRKRLQRAKIRLTKLRSFKAKLSVKTTLLKGGIYPLAFYGLCVLPLGQQHFDQLRPLCADGLFGRSASRNSAIALVACPKALDPSEYAIIPALRAIKRFVLQLDDVQYRTFCSLASQHDGTATSCHGRAGACAFWLAKLGWQLDPQGNIRPMLFTSCHCGKRECLC